MSLKRNIEGILMREIIDPFIGEFPARKAARILMYYSKIKDDSNNHPILQRVPQVWKGMKDLEIEPYLDHVTIQKEGSLDYKEMKIYFELDSIVIGLAVCINKGFISNLAEEHTQYSLTAKGRELIERFSS